MLTRRSFIGLAGFAALQASTFSTLLSQPLTRPLRRIARPVRVRGRVEAARRGLARVVVSDGRSVVQTAADGTFELVSDTSRRYVQLSLPAGYRIPTQQSGTAQLFRRLEPGPRGEMDARFTLDRLETGDDHHAFFLNADPQTETLEETGFLLDQTVPDAARSARGLGDLPIFGVGCGDIMFDDLSLYPEYEKAVRGVGVPYFQVVGNHDLDFDVFTDEASTATFERHFGPTYYSFNRGQVHYVVLDDVFWHGRGYIGYLGADQLAWLEQDLATVERGASVIVFLHIPVGSTQPDRTGRDNDYSTRINNSGALYRLLEPYQAHILSGHTHESEHVFEGGVHEHVNGTTCGAWWSGPICFDGTPNGYSIYQVRGSAVQWNYKSTGLDRDRQLRIYPVGADPRAPDEIVANVWNWDPEWKVVWFEDGVRRGAMARRNGLDPLSVKLHAGPDLPLRRKWVDPVPTDHLFYATPGEGTREIVIEATDRFGASWKDRIAL